MTSSTFCPNNLKFKIIVVGDSGVGKTNIINRFCLEQFSFSLTSTIGLDFKYKKLDIQDKHLEMQIWDTAGQQRYQNMTKSYFKKVSAILLVFSLENRSSFKNIEKWLKIIQNQVDQRTPKVLVGSKFDLSQNRAVSLSEASILARKYQMQYEEVSSKLNFNIEKPFQILARELLELSVGDDSQIKPRGVTRLSSWKHHVNSCQC